MIISNLTLLIFFSMLYIVGLSYLYFSKSRIDNGENKIYKVLLISNLVGLILQFGCDFVSFKYDSIPRIFSDLTFRLYLIYFIVWIVLVILYLIEVSFKNKKQATIIMIVLTIVLSIIITLLPYDLYRNVANGIYYTYGNAVNFTFISSGSLSLLIFIILIVKNKKITRKKALPIYLFLIFGILAMLIQMLKPELVITAAMESLICCLMYFTIENPDLKVIEKLTMANEVAEKANRAKTEFLSSMSHEIRTPLNAIVGFSDCIIQENSIEEAKKDADDIIMASQNLLEIVNGILDISKIEANKMEIVNTNYNLSKELDNIVKLITPRLIEKPIELKTKFASDIPYMLYGDVGKVKQIMTNIMTNAVKYTEHGEINFNVSCINENDTTSLVISISDTGRGIKPEKIDTLFTKFNRLDEDRNTTLEGTGLGLAITKSFVDMMGGKIVVQSKYGKGSQFTIYLKQKIVQMHETQTYAKVEIEDEQISYPDKKVLIVDDNKLNLKVINKLLSKYNVTSVMVESGEECLDLVNKGEHYDLIFMDDMMPKMRGPEVLEKLKEIKDFHMPVIALTANALTGMKEHYLKLGFNDYLAKPIERVLLEQMLQKFFENNDKKELKKILMVDDNKININIATRLLKSGNYEIDKAYSGKECIDKIERGEVYDMILMDDMMPGLSGTETLEYLKNNSDFKSTIVVVTANALSGSEEKYLKAGFDAYIPKPINREVLNKTVEDFLYKQK